MSKITSFFVSSGLLFSILSPIWLVGGVAYAEDAMTYGSYCTLLNSRMSLYEEGSDGWKGIQADHQRLCSDLGNNRYRQTVPQEELSKYVSDGVDYSRVVDKTFDLENTKIRAKEYSLQNGGGDLGSQYATCKHQAVEMLNTCTSRAGVLMNSAGSLYNQVLMQFNNDKQVENACGKVSDYSSSAANAASSVRSECEEHKRICEQQCANADAMARESKALGSMTADMKADRDEGARNCARIEAVIAKVESDKSSNERALQNACTAARERDKNTEKPVASRDDKASGSGTDTMNKMLQGAASALPLVSALMNSNQQQQPGLYYAPNTGTQQTPQYNMGGGEQAPMIGKGGGGLSSTSPSAAIPLGDGDLNMGLSPNSEASRRNSPPQQRGGGGGVGAGGGGGPVAANKKNRRGGKSDFNPNIYQGNYGSGGGPGGGRGTAQGYNDPTWDSEHRGGAPGAVLPGGKVGANQLDQYRPTWFARREVATVTGPDGLTGPHTNLFRKVRYRYNEMADLEAAIFGK